MSQAQPRIEVLRRAESGRCELLEARPGETIELASLGVRLDVAAIYANPLEGDGEPGARPSGPR